MTVQCCLSSFTVAVYLYAYIKSHYMLIVIIFYIIEILKNVLFLYSFFTLVCTFAEVILLEKMSYLVLSQ